MKLCDLFVNAALLMELEVSSVKRMNRLKSDSSGTNGLRIRFPSVGNSKANWAIEMEESIRPTSA
jgi:hypothetical protein